MVSLSITPPAAAAATGDSVAPVDRFALSVSIFLRTLALTHAIAFVSFWSQLSGLIGPRGILPANTFLTAIRAQFGASAFFELPTLAWLFGADKFLHLLCAFGVIAASLLFAGITPALCLAVLWACYLSLVGVGQIFLGFQWDALLLEVTLFAIFLTPRSRRLPWRGIEPSRIARLLLTWLLFRLMLLSGVVKLTSGDPTWRDLTALTFHFETQPLPNPLAWWAHQLPESYHRAACTGLFVIELVVPLFLFAPRALRHNAALLLASLQIIIALTGNYTFFNLLTFALCLLSLDDAWWHRVLPRHFLHHQTIPPHPSPAPATDASQRTVTVTRSFTTINAIAALAVVLYTSLQALPSLGLSAHVPDWFRSVTARVAPFRSLNNYGLFAVMTTSRPELIIEGSNDAREWLPYELPDKPGDLARRPTFVAPHQPRLDWQLWFAALGQPQHNRWVHSLCEHLLRGTPQVLHLFAYNPFPDAPPRYIRVVRYDYRFTSRADRERTDHWWHRAPTDYYVPPASLIQR